MSYTPNPLSCNFALQDGLRGPVTELQLVFGEADQIAYAGAFAQPAGQLSGSVASAIVVQGAFLQAAGILAGDVVLRQPLRASFGIGTTVPRAERAGVGVAVASLLPAQASSGLDWGALGSVFNQVSPAWSAAKVRLRQLDLAQRHLSLASASVHANWVQVDPQAQLAASLWRQSAIRAWRGVSYWTRLRLVGTRRRAPWLYPQTSTGLVGSPWRRPLAPKALPALPWDRPYAIWPVYRPSLPVLPQPIPPTTDWNPESRRINFCLGDPLTSDFDLRWRPACDCGSRSVIVQHSASLAVWPSLEPLDGDLISARLSYNRGDLAWQATLTMADTPAARAIAPSLSGVSEVLLTLDGWQWLLVIDGSSEDRRFGESTLSFSGKSTSAYLAAPWAESASHSETQDRTAAQLAAAEITNAGFTLDWQVLDWLVPAGAWRYEGKSPAEALSTVAAAVGGVLVPARAAKALSVQYRHPAPSWNWGNVTPDRAIPAGLILRQSSRFEAATQHNKVYVFGGAVSGEAAGVRRAGTAGDKAAETIIDPLIVSLPPAQERGRQVLSASGNRLIVQIELPLMPAADQPGLVEPGLIVGMPEGWHGLVTAISVEAGWQGEGGLSIRQALTLERAA